MNWCLVNNLNLVIVKRTLYKTNIKPQHANFTMILSPNGATNFDYEPISTRSVNFFKFCTEPIQTNFMT